MPRDQSSFLVNSLGNIYSSAFNRKDYLVNQSLEICGVLSVFIAQSAILSLRSFCSMLASESYLVTEFSISIYRRKTEIPSNDSEYKLTRLKKQYNFSTTSYPVAVKFLSDGLPSN